MTRNRQRKPLAPPVSELEEKLARDLENLEEMLDLALALYPPVPGEPRIPKKPARPYKPVANPRPVTPEREREVHEFTKLLLAEVREQHAERQRRLSLPW